MTQADASTGDTETAIAAARAGADVVRDMYGQHLARIDKGAGDFATEADVAAEKAILDVIRAARQWLVDPLCGTLNYAVGTRLVAVNVALRDGAAAVADPFSGDTSFTDGRTAHVRRQGAAEDTPLTPTPDTRLVDLNLDPPFPSAPDHRAVGLLTHPDFTDRFRPRVGSTSLALAWVAAGKRAAYVTDGGDLTGSVHFAAGIALCRAAGCVVTGVDGAPLGPSGRGPVAAADEDTHARLLTMLRRQAPDGL
ncbi:inositol monophosphatase family protein [Streptomyces althioticus]|uniref:inositol monophosphatase family protein n=1 Tax=Streptomyces TaxID=1883 RepID=UPI00367E0577